MDICRRIQPILTRIAIVLAVANAGFTGCFSAELLPIQIGTAARIEVTPSRFQLTGVREKLHLIVTGYDEHGEIQDLTRVAQFATSDSKVALVKDGVVYPQGDGQVAIHVRVAGQKSTAEIGVSGQTKPQPVSFQHGVLPALSKQGCNAGACHGSPSGKGGFRLSLRAFDSQLDEYTLLREEFGRRVNPLDPEASLLLQKPLMQVTHGGGMKMSTHDSAYKVLRDWIGEGCQIDAPAAPRCVGIEIIPGAKRILKRPAHTQQLCVLAKFSDGSVRDITQLAVYSSSDMDIANVDARGLVVGNDRGEAAIIVRYLEFIESTFLTFVKDIDGYQWTDPPANNYIDRLVHAKLKQLQYLPSDICTDEEFLRRVYLDLLGILPTISEVTQFLADDAPAKRDRLIDNLLERPEFAKFWALKWGDLLRMTSGQVGAEGVFKYHRWLERAMETNMPYDEFARSLLTASGSTFDNPPANFYRTSTNTNDRVETVSQIFLGERLACPKCHNHPFERWTQDNYYGMGAFFHRVQRKKTRRSGEWFVWSSTTGDVTQPRTGEKMKPWVPVVGVIDHANAIDRRTTFANWLTADDNPFFARIEVNRIWSHLFGRGIVDPPDDFRDSNPPSIGRLLDALAEDFVDHEFDRKHMIRTILKSRTYQMSHRPNAFNRGDSKYFSHYQPRILGAEQLLDAICHVTGVEEKFDNLPPRTKATQLAAPDLVAHEFLKVFGQPERQTVCQCERSTDSSLGMAIEFLNGPLIHKKVNDQSNRFRQMVDSDRTDKEIITALHMVALSRPPTDNELMAGMRHLSAKQTQIGQENIAIKQQVVELGLQLSKTRERTIQKLKSARMQSLPEAIRTDTQVALETVADQRTEIQRYLVAKLGSLFEFTDEEISKGFEEATKKEFEKIQAEISELNNRHKSVDEIRVIGLEDICWVLLNRNEFLFNH